MLSNREHRNDPKRRNGFTLLELLAVLIVFVLLSGIVLLSLADRVSQTRLNHTARRVAELDSRIRRAARTQRSPLVMEYDQRNHSVRSSLSGMSVVALPDGIEIEQVIGTGGRRDGLRVVMNARGQSATYALRIGNEGERTKWIVVCGLTGNVIEVETDQELRQYVSSALRS